MRGIIYPIQWLLMRLRRTFRAISIRRRFPNVPHRLARAVLTTPDEMRVLPHRYLYPAAFVIAEYLRRNPTGSEADAFFDFKPKADSSVSFEHTIRVTMVGETLFLLRSQPGFPEFCRRFQGRDFRSTMFELIAARMFLRGGFELYARPEVGAKTKDFDFQAVRTWGYGMRDKINVEVTALTTASFSEQTVKNALNAKRKQLPNDLPAIIFCVYPESWVSVGPDAVRSGLVEAANRFFSSKRVNVVVFMGEQHWDAAGNGTLGALFITHLPVVNPGARRPISSLKFLLDVSAHSPRSVVQRNDLIKEVPWMLNSEFYQWVDALFNETSHEPMLR